MFLISVHIQELGYADCDGFQVVSQDDLATEDRYCVVVLLSTDNVAHSVPSCQAFRRSTFVFRSVVIDTMLVTSKCAWSG